MTHVDNVDKYLGNSFKKPFHEIDVKYAEREGYLRNEPDSYKPPVDGPAVVTENKTYKQEKQHSKRAPA